MYGAERDGCCKVCGLIRALQLNLVIQNFVEWLVCCVSSWFAINFVAARERIHWTRGRFEP